MGFFDDLKVIGSDLLAKGGEVAKEAAQKAQDAADMAKIKVDIAAREKEIKDLYTKIGKTYYEAHKDDAELYAEDIAEIKAKFTLIGELTEKLNTYKEAMTSAKEEQGAEVQEEAVDTIELIPVKEVMEEATVTEEATEDASEEVTE